MERHRLISWAASLFLTFFVSVALAQTRPLPVIQEKAGTHVFPGWVEARNLVSDTTATLEGLGGGGTLCLVTDNVGTIGVAAADCATVGNPITDFTANNWKVFYSDGSGDVQELALGGAGTVLASQGASVAPVFSSSVFDHDMTGPEHETTAWKVYYSDGAPDVQELAIGATDSVLTSNGVAAAPSWQSVPSWADTLLGGTTITDVTGGGGEAQGQILYRNASSQWTYLAPGTSGQFLQTQGAGANPQWASATVAWDDITNPDNSGQISWSFDNNERMYFTTNLNTATYAFLDIYNTTDNPTNSPIGIRLSTDEENQYGAHQAVQYIYQQFVSDADGTPSTDYWWGDRLEWKMANLSQDNIAGWVHLIFTGISGAGVQDGTRIINHGTLMLDTVPIDSDPNPLTDLIGFRLYSACQDYIGPNIHCDQTFTSWIGTTSSNGVQMDWLKFDGGTASRFVQIGEDLSGTVNDLQYFKVVVGDPATSDSAVQLPNASIGPDEVTFDVAAVGSLKTQCQWLEIMDLGCGAGECSGPACLKVGSITACRATFGSTGDDFGEWWLQIPANFAASGDITFEIWWTTAQLNSCNYAGGGDDVCWTVGTDSHGDGTALFLSTLPRPTNDVAVNDVCDADDELYKAPTVTITSANHGLVAGEFAQIEIVRPDTGSCGTNDDINSDVGLVGVNFCYEVDSAFAGE